MDPATSRYSEETLLVSASENTSSSLATPSLVAKLMRWKYLLKYQCYQFKSVSSSKSWALKFLLWQLPQHWSQCRRGWHLWASVAICWLTSGSLCSSQLCLNSWCNSESHSAPTAYAKAYGIGPKTPLQSDSHFLCRIALFALTLPLHKCSSTTTGGLASYLRSPSIESIARRSLIFH